MTKITLNKAEQMYKKEIADNTINTETTLHYNSLNKYCNMLRDTGYIIKEDNKEILTQQNKAIGKAHSNDKGLSDTKPLRRKFKKFFTCPNCNKFGGLVGEPLKRVYRNVEGEGRCPKCKDTYLIKEMDEPYKSKKICPKCETKFKPVKTWFWVCEKCNYGG